MGTQGPSPRITLSDTLAVFEEADVPGTPFTTSEVAEELDCARRTAYDKLESLADRGDLETKKAGARGRVWWRPVDGADAGAVDGDEEPSVDQAQFEELVQEVTDYAIFVLDPDGNVTSWNDGAESIKGYEADEILGEHFSTFYTEADREAGVPERNLQAALENGRTEDEGKRVRKDGSTFWANVVITTLHDDDGDLRGFMKVTRDMTERHEYEQRLHREKERFETLVREVEDYAIFMLDPDGHVRSWNEGIRQIKGYDREEILGKHFSTFYTDEDREAGVPDRNLEAAAREGRVEDEGTRVRKDGSTFWANVVITALHDDDGDLRGFAKVTRDMTERHEYEQRLRDQRDELAELDRINAVIRDIDQALVAATTREEAEAAVCERLATSDPYSGAWVTEFTEDYEVATVRARAGDADGVDDADPDADLPAEHRVAAAALRNRAVQSARGTGDDADASWQGAGSADDPEMLVAIPLVHNDVEYGVLVVRAEDESAFDERKLSVLGELGETTSHAVAAIKRKERERALTALQESTRELLHTESHAEIGDVVVSTLTRELGYSDAVLYRFDTSRNVLDPVSSSLDGDAYAGESLTLTAGDDSPVWTSFVEGGSGVVDQDDDAVIPRRGFGGRSEMVVPLGDDGVLAVAAPAEETFDANDRNLVRLVAATVEAAFERVESQANLRERDSILQEQNQRLQRLNQINTVIREVDKGLVQATTHDEIRNVVCERLTDNDRFRFAWIGVPDADGTITPQTWGGEERGYLDSVALSSGDDPDEPAVRAARTGSVSVVPNVADDIRTAPWRKEAFSREFQSAIGVPLRYGDVTYGILAVYADRPEVFGEMEQSVFEELGQTIANTINAVETKQRLLSDKIVELEFRLSDESAGFLSRLAEQVGCEITFDGIIPLTEQKARVYFTARGAGSGTVRDVLDRAVGVDSYEFLASSDDEHLFEAVISGPTIPSMLVEHGASLQDLTVTDGVVNVVVDLPSDADVREFIERFQHRYESAEFVARRERERPARTRDGFRMELEEYLTDRQLEVLQTAYFSGFFSSPRRSTGGDIADRLDVSQPTVTEHLRTAQYKILDLLFDDDATA